MASAFNRQRRVVILGFSFVGKTAISRRFCADKFNDRYEPTYENSFRKVIRHRGQDIDVIITDTQGQDEQELFRNEYCIGAHAYVLVFSLTSPRSLQNVKVINDKLINLVGHKNIARVLVGSKQDLDTERRIPVQECMELAREWGCPYVECSAKQNINVEEIFRLSLQEVDRFSCEDIRPPSIWSRCAAKLPTFTPESALLILSCLSLSWGLGILACATWMGIYNTPDNDGSHSLASYLLFALSLLVSMSSALGVYGVRTMRRGYIMAFACTLWAIIPAQIALLSYMLYMSIPFQMPWELGIVAVLALCIQVTGSVVAWQLQRDLRHVLPDHYDYYQPIPGSTDLYV